LNWFFDSSALVPVFYADHPHHGSSAKVFLTATKQDFCALHTLAEVYATLTGLPLRPRISGADGITILKQIRDRLTLISLGEAEYVEAIESVSATIIGGAAYDALIARCALKAQAETL
jgi:predicted nucleic acid-binding protein